MIQSNHRKFHGISLLELMLALVIIAMIVFTVTRYYSVTEENLKVTQAEEMINNIVKGSYQWGQGQPNYTALSTQALIDAGFIPDNYKVNPWKGLTVISGTVPYPSTQPYIRMTDIPVASCWSLYEKIKSQARVGCTTISNGTASFEGAF
jgi:type II secretory pathway pseudopilin PulG